MKTLIRVCQLREGDIFVRLGSEYYVTNIKEQVKCYSTGTTNSIKLGAKSQEFVELVGRLPDARHATVIQCDITGRHIRTWTSLGAAAVETNTSRVGIMRCLNGFQKSANHFIWKRA